MTTRNATTASLWVALLLLAGCPSQSEYALVNQQASDCFSVSVTPDSDGDDDDSAGDDDDSADPGETIELDSIPGVFSMDVVGTARISQTSGPAGTEFFVTVALIDTGADTGNPTTVVERVTLLVDNGDIALNELELDPSPADERNWTITVVAGGDPDTTERTDSLCVGLYATE